MPYNYLIDYILLDDGEITEPVTVEEAKNYCRVTTNADDQLISDMITEAREAVEIATGLSLTNKLVEIWFNNGSGNFSIPYGPMKVDSFKLYDLQTGNEITSQYYKLIGFAHPSLYFPNWTQLRATYRAGMDTIPKDLKIAILDQIDYDYENRGADIERYDQSGVCQKTWRACQRYTRVSPIL